MKSISATLIIMLSLFITGCSTKQPQVKEKIVYKIQYVYLPCVQPKKTPIVFHKIPKNIKPKVKKETKKQTKKVQPKKVAAKKIVKKRKFYLPKKTVKYFAPKRYTVRSNQKMNFMVGYNSDGSAFLYLEGEFGEDTYKNFLHYINESDINFGEIKVNSNGGVVATAMQIGAYVYDHKWNTGVDKEMKCLSACSFVYFAGIKKSLQGKAVIGLHRPYLPGVPDTLKSIRKTKKEYIGYWNYIHAPKSIYDEMMDVDRDDLFILNKENINDYIDVTIK